MYICPSRLKLAAKVADDENLGIKNSANSNQLRTTTYHHEL